MPPSNPSPERPSMAPAAPFGSCVTTTSAKSGSTVGASAVDIDDPAEALGRKGDVFIAYSTSGNSPNIVAALRTAREMGLVTVGMTGNRRGATQSRPGNRVGWASRTRPRSYSA